MNFTESVLPPLYSHTLYSELQRCGIGSSKQHNYLKNVCTISVSSGAGLGRSWSRIGVANIKRNWKPQSI